MDVGRSHNFACYSTETKWKCYVWSNVNIFLGSVANNMFMIAAIRNKKNKTNITKTKQSKKNKKNKEKTNDNS